MNYAPIRQVFQEIKTRCFYLITSFCLTFSLCYQNSTQIIYLIVKPSYKLIKKTNQFATANQEIQDIRVSKTATINYLDCNQDKHFISQDNSKEMVEACHFIYTNVTEAFYATLQGCMVVSVMFTLPLLTYHCWCFLMPSCYARERYHYNKLLTNGFLYIACSLCIITYVLVPHIGTFLHMFAVTTQKLQIVNQARIYPYMSWLLYTVANLFLVSLMPMVMYFALHRNYISLSFLSKNRRAVLLLLVVLGALISPPDLTSQLIATLFLFLFSECIVWVYIYNLHAGVTGKLGETRSA